MRHSIFLSLLLGLNALGLPLCAQQERAVEGAGPLDGTPLTPAAAAKEETAPNPQPLDNNQKAPDAEPKRDNRSQQSEMRLRAMMNDLGLEDTAKQDAVVVYLKEDEAGKNVVRSAQRRLSFAVTHDANITRIRDLIAVVKAALDADKERRSAAQTALDAKIGFSLDPRVEAALWLCGVLGDGQIGSPLNFGQVRGQTNRDFKDNANGNWQRGNNADFGDGKTPKRPENVSGTVANKGVGWIEVRDEKGITERYLTFWTATDGTAGNGYDRALLESIRTIALGAPVRLWWVWSERKRVIKIEPSTPPVKEQPETTPTVLNAPAIQEENHKKTEENPHANKPKEEQP